MTTTTTNRRILLIEDDADARLLFKRVLSDAGYTVDALPEGNSFINFNWTLPDLFILDNCMPTIDGVALTKYLKVKKQTSEIPVLIVSANPVIATKAKKAGASGFIAKPFEAHVFLETVRQLVLHKDISGEK